MLFKILETLFSVFVSNIKSGNKGTYKINVDHPTKTVTIHGPDSPYGPVKDAKYKQNTSSGNFGIHGGWHTGLTYEQASEIASNYEKKGYKLKKYKT